MQSANLTAIILLALSANLDNIVVGVSYGARNIRVPFAVYLLITMITGGGTLLSMLAGEKIHNFLNPGLATHAGSFFIISIGLWILLKEVSQLRKEGKRIQERQQIVKPDISNKSFFQKIIMILENPFAADMDRSGHISFKEGLFLGAALTLNNLALGVGAGMLGLNPVLTTFFVALLCIITIWASIEIGRSYIYRRLGSYSGIAAGILLVLFGIIMIYA